MPPESPKAEGLPEISTPLSDAASGLHEMFASLIGSGFTEWQACHVLGVYLAESGRQT